MRLAHLGAGDERQGDLGSPTTKGHLVSLQAGGSPRGLASWLGLGGAPGSMWSSALNGVGVGVDTGEAASPAGRGAD